MSLLVRIRMKIRRGAEPRLLLPGLRALVLIRRASKLRTASEPHLRALLHAFPDPF